MSTSSYHKGDVPEATLRAARGLLDRMPASDISVRELARAAGVSHAAPYRHFGDRDGFLLALTARCLEEFVAAQRRAFDAAPSGDRLVAIGAAYADFARRHPHVFGLVYAGRPGQDDRLDRAIAEHVELLVAAVDDAGAAGMLPPAAPGAVTPGDGPPEGGRADVEAALWALAHGLAQLVGAGLLPPERTRAILGALLRSPVG